jgi:hypothetical protein
MAPNMKGTDADMKSEDMFVAIELSIGRSYFCVCAHVRAHELICWGGGVIACACTLKFWEKMLVKYAVKYAVQFNQGRYMEPPCL